ncbi:MAG: LuxR C-terminal-related transcriptional regulator [Candidatus Saccharimonadales bacterium]
MNPAIRLLLADGHELIRIGVRTLFQSEPNLQLVGETDNFNDTLQLARQLSPDVILLDMQLKEGLVTERIPELPSTCPDCKILMFTACPDRDMHLLALRLGAIGIFLKDQPPRLLLKAIHSVHSGEVWVDNSLASGLLQSFKLDTSKTAATETSKENLFTSRELSIAHLAAQGLPAKKIAAQLFISEKTVRNQLVVIYSKLGVASQVELVLQASRLGLFSSV